MKYLLLNLISQHEKNKDNAVARSYSEHFSGGQEARKKKSQELWVTLKKDITSTTFTLDNLFAIIVDGCISATEVQSFLKIIQTHSPSRKALINTLDPSVYGFGNEIDLQKQLSPQDPDIIESINRVRHQAGKIIENLFLQKPKFIQAVYNLCPQILNEFHHNYLKKILLNNNGAIVLLTDIRYIQKLTSVLTVADIFELFSNRIPDEYVSAYTLILLDYCCKFHLSSLKTILKEIGELSVADSYEKEKQLSTIQSKLLSCGEELLFFLEKNPAIMPSFLLGKYFYCDILRLAKNPIQFLQKITEKEIELSNWLAEHLVNIIALLLRISPDPYAVRDLIKQGVAFVLKTRKFSYQEILNSQISQCFENQNETDYVLQNNVYQILENDEIRKLIKPNIIFTGLSNQYFSGLIERIIVEDDYLWGTLNSFVARVPQHDTIFNAQVFLKARKISNEAECPAELKTVKTYLIANNLPQWKKSLKNHSLDVSNIVFSIRTEYDKKEGAKEVSFRQYFINTFIKKYEEISPRITDYDLDLFCSLAQGNDLIKLLKKLNQHCKRMSCVVLFGKNLFFVQMILKNPYYAAKLAQALNEFNLKHFVDFLKDASFMRWIDCEVLLNFLLKLDIKQQIDLIKNVNSNKEFIFKICHHHAHKNLVRKATLFIADEQICKELFHACSVEDFIWIFEMSDLTFIQSLFLNASHGGKILGSIRGNLFRLQEETLLRLLTKSGLNKLIFEQLTEVQWITFLTSKVACNSRELMEKLFMNPPYVDVVSNFKGEVLFKSLQENKYFAEFFLNNPTMVALTPEELIGISILPEFKQTVFYLLNLRDSYLKAIIQTNLDQLTQDMQQLLTSMEWMPLCQKMDQVHTPIPRLTIKHSLWLKNSISPFLRIVLERKQKTKFLHQSIRQDFTDGIEELVNAINDTAVELDISTVPLCFLVCDEIYQLFIEYIEKSPDKVARYLKTSHQDIQALKAEKNNAQHILLNFILINRIKDIELILLKRYAQLYDQDSENHIHNFRKKLSTLTNHSLSDILKLLSDKHFVLAVFSCLYSKGASVCTKTTDITLRLVLAQSPFLDKEKLNCIRADILRQSCMLPKDAVEYVSPIYTPSFLLESENSISLIAYFLRNPWYVKALPNKKILQLATSSCEAAQCCFVYPHLYERLNETSLAVLATQMLGFNSLEDMQVNSRISGLLKGLFKYRESLNKDENVQLSISEQRNTTVQLFDHLNSDREGLIQEMQKTSEVFPNVLFLSDTKMWTVVKTIVFDMKKLTEIALKMVRVLTENTIDANELDKAIEDIQSLLPHFDNNWEVELRTYRMKICHDKLKLFKDVLLDKINTATESMELILTP